MQIRLTGALCYVLCSVDICVEMSSLASAYGQGVLLTDDARLQLATALSQFVTSRRASADVGGGGHLKRQLPPSVCDLNMSLLRELSKTCMMRFVDRVKVHLSLQVFIPCSNNTLLSSWSAHLRDSYNSGVFSLYWKQENAQSIHARRPSGVEMAYCSTSGEILRKLRLVSTKRLRFTCT